uniref:large ribosomal subunit protein uL30m-like n=1 Tax=Myxine glutinosa TaxID=7769 RepID=UPI00358DE3E2
MMFCSRVIGCNALGKLLVFSSCPSQWLRNMCSTSHAGSVFKWPEPKPRYYPSEEDHKNYGGDPEQPHQLHVVYRIRSALRRPYWEKNMVKMLGLTKKRYPVIHKNTPSVNNRLNTIRHLIQIKPLKLPQGLPTEEELQHCYINSKGELIIHKCLEPIEQKQVGPS